MALNKTLSFDLELKPGGIPPIIHASQGDIGRMFKANIYWDGSAATSYVSGATVNLRGKKPDKTVFDYTATLAGSMVTFETTEQMTIISGPVECELVFSNDGDIIASANFVLIVEDSPYDPNNLSESEVEGLTDVLAGFQRLNRDSNGVVKIGDGVTASGTAEPIKGFYVHDEATNTDGVAKYDYDALENSPDVEGYAEQLANGEDVYKRTNLDGFVSGQIHNEGLNLENPVASTNTAYFPKYYGKNFKVYFDDTNYNIIVCAYDEDKAYIKNQLINTSPFDYSNLYNTVNIGEYYAFEIRNKSASALDVAAANASGAYTIELLAETTNNAFLSILSNEITGAKLTGVNLLDNPSWSNQSGVTPTEKGSDIASGGYYFTAVQLEKLEDVAYYCFTCEQDIEVKWAWANSSNAAISPYNSVSKRGKLYYAEVKKADAPASAVGVQLRLDNRTGSETLSFSKVILANGSYASALNLDKIAYVSTSGSDTNNGETRSTAFATMQKAIDSGAKTILVKEGTYTNKFTMENLSGVTIALDHYYDAYTVGTDEDNPKIIIDTSRNEDDGATIKKCVNCRFSNIEVKNAKLKGFNIQKCDGLRFDDCIVHDIGIGQSGSIGGFVIVSTDADFYNCIAYNIGTTTAGTGAYHYDGFNIHITGTTNFYNCSAWNCEDDGISHHDACCGFIDGGEWYGCGKGGIASPTHGAHIDVKNAYCHDNGYGIYAYADCSGMVTQRAPINITNCVCKNNRSKDIGVGSYYTANVWNCIYNTSEGFTELA